MKKAQTSSLVDVEAACSDDDDDDADEDGNLKGFVVDEVDLEEMDARQRRKADRSNPDAMDEDDDGARQGVQCANQ